MNTSHGTSRTDWWVTNAISRRRNECMDTTGSKGGIFTWGCMRVSEYFNTKIQMYNAIILGYYGSNVLWSSDQYAGIRATCFPPAFILGMRKKMLRRRGNDSSSSNGMRASIKHRGVINCWFATSSYKPNTPDPPPRHDSCLHPEHETISRDWHAFGCEANNCILEVSATWGRFNLLLIDLCDHVLLGNWVFWWLLLCIQARCAWNWNNYMALSKYNPHEISSENTWHWDFHKAYFKQQHDTIYINGLGLVWPWPWPSVQGGTDHLL